MHTQSTQPTEANPMTQSTQPTEANPMTQSTQPTEANPMTQSTQPTEANPMTQSTPSTEANISSYTESKQNKQESFPGWFAIDFGTSNSTVTLFDPIEVAISDILPEEQKQTLFKLLAEWLTSSPNEALAGIESDDWKKFTADISKSLEMTANTFDQVFQGGSEQQCLEAIRQIELCLGKSEKFRRLVSKKLYEIYHQVFRIPALKSQSLRRVVLDMNSGEIEIPSELEITELNGSDSSSPLKVKVEMGREAKSNKNKAIAQVTSNGEGSSKEIISKFHHSPKRHFGQNKKFSVSLKGNEPKEITADELVQAAWAHLIELTENYRKNAKGRFSKGDFKTAVVTYPTIAPPIVRKQVKELVKKLGIENVQTAYDEAVAVVMFYLWREFGGYLNIGIESFKTRCRRQGDNWSQNVLVLDIGGGTTDIALIKLTLSDITPSLNAREQGLGGRYYQITPKLLGSSGHLQLGGELITLRVFRLLKVAIVERLLSAIAKGELNNQKLNDLIPNLEERFLQQGKYKQGSLLSCIDKQYPENDRIAYEDALNTADKVLSTRWEDAPKRLQTFYTLWDHAENAKLQLGKKPPSDGSGLTFTLSEQQIYELLNQVEINIESEPSNNLDVTLTSEQFERAAYSVIKESVAIAKGLMESRLASENKSNNDYYHTQEDGTEQNDTEQKEIELEKVDWLILSGKTCHLNLVEREIEQEFSNSDFFLWNRERITFDPKFTKQGTSAGACYAENMRQLMFAVEESKELLGKGANQLRIDVKNLFYYLPCNFKRRTQSSDLLNIFTAGTQLYLISPNDEVAKVRTEWLGIQLSTIVYRQDYEGGNLQLWGSFDGNKLYEELKKSMSDITEQWFEKQIKIQFEIDSALNINILLCKEEPHYLIDDNSDGDGTSIDVNEIINKEINGDGDGNSSNLNQGEGEEKESSTKDFKLFSQGKLQWDVYVVHPEKELKNGDIAVNVIESAAVNYLDACHLVFEAAKDNLNNDNSKKFHYRSNNETKNTETSNSKVLNGLISEPLPNFPESGKHTFYICEIEPQNNQKKWLRIGELRKPDVATEFPCKYSVSLDENGILRMHAGEVPYWEVDKQQEWLTKSEVGYVLRTELELQPNDVDVERNPFSGTH